MGEEVLVRRDIEDGARLVRYLTSQGFPFTSALWARISDAEEWRLFIAVSAQEKLSRSRAYGMIQKTLQLHELALPLSRISLVSDDDSSIKSLRALIDSSKNDTTELRFGPSEIAGQRVDEVYAYRPGPLVFEQQVLMALRKMSDLGRVVEARELLRFDSPRKFDFAFLSGRQVIFVEVKALSRKIGVTHIWEIVQLPDHSMKNLPLPHRCLIVSKSGFTDAAQEYGREFSPFLGLVTWKNSKDDPLLRKTLLALLRENEA